MWSPIELPDLLDSIRSSETVMQPDIRRLWAMIRVEPAKWQQHPWGDEGGGFWVVGLLGRQALWYNDIEDGFNISRYTACGTIDEYWCNHDELHHAMHTLRRQLDTGEVAGRLGPPEPLNGGTSNA
jgi:hypothetical protein